MKRRQFLRASLVTVTGWSVACATDIKTTPAEGTDTGSGTDTGAELEFVPGLDRFPQSIASGDPRPDSIILWARVEPTEPGTDMVEVVLEVFEDEAATRAATWEGGPQLRLMASAEHDHCIKVRVTGLAADTTYYYRFALVDGTQALTSVLGRTKTAPAADSDRTIKFAFTACQDYAGRYYNGYAHLAKQEVDFFVHLGDYIYETAGDSGFQGEGDERPVAFTDTAGALEVSRSGGSSFTAAKSLDNYRELYRIFRGDAALQAAHERIPMLAIWDDHEFSDDCWGATATYLDGRADERDAQRRQNANQAWFEYMPVDYVDPEFEYDRAVAPPDDIQIWRDFVFGRHVHLVLTDLRSRRSDHLIPEDAYPGVVVLTQAELEASGGLPDDARPYVTDIDALAGGAYATALRDAATAAGFPTDAIVGPISVAWINSVLAASESSLDPIDETAAADLPRGYAFTDLMKGSYYSRIGSRYLVARDAFARYAADRWTKTEGASEQAMGPAQEAWFLDKMASSTATWKVWGNEYCLSPLQIDLRPLGVPEAFRRVFHINVDDWNGMPNRRDQLLAQLAAIPNVVAITGDIHAFFASTPSVSGDPSKKLVEFVTSSISTATLQALLQSQVATDPVLSGVPGAASLAAAIRELLQASGGPNPHLGFADVVSHGYVMVEASADALHATYYKHPEAEALVNHYDDANLDQLFTVVRFRVDAGSPELYQQFDDEWRRWDSESATWV